MKSQNPCRCVKCSGEFVPDPRVGDRQVTCGRPECQQARHADQCRWWHASNAQVAASHYQDVVVPFRKAQPDYQSRWRWWQRLREIREQSQQFGGALLASLQALVSRAKLLARRAEGVVQSGVLAGEMLERAVTAVRATISALEQLQASTAELRQLGL
jgi:multidrug resistance efflux pump